MSGAQFSLAPAPGRPNNTYTAGRSITIEDPDGGNVRIGEELTVVSTSPSDGGIQTILAGLFTFIADAKVSYAGFNCTGIIVEDGSGKYFMLSDTNLGRVNLNVSTLTLTSFVDTICFLAGTLIATPDGPVAVETLERGDRVLAHDGSVPRASR